MAIFCCLALYVPTEHRPSPNSGPCPFIHDWFDFATPVLYPFPSRSGLVPRERRVPVLLPSCLSGDWWVTVTMPITAQEPVKDHVLLEFWAQFAAPASLKKSVMCCSSQKNYVWQCSLTKVGCIKPKSAHTTRYCRHDNAFRCIGDILLPNQEVAASLLASSKHSKSATILCFLDKHR